MAITSALCSAWSCWSGTRSCPTGKLWAAEVCTASGAARASGNRSRLLRLLDLLMPLLILTSIGGGVHVHILVLV